MLFNRDPKTGPPIGGFREGAVDLNIAYPIGQAMSASGDGDGVLQIFAVPCHESASELRHFAGSGDRSARRGHLQV